MECFSGLHGVLPAVPDISHQQNLPVTEHPAAACPDDVQLNILARELVASGDVYNSGYGLFTSEQARKDWNNARKKLSRAKVKKTVVVDPDLIWSLPDGEIRRYDGRLNIICSECRKSEVMKRVLMFYRGSIQEFIR